MKNLLEHRDHLRAKLVLEGLTEKEMNQLASINYRLNEAPIDYEGPERMAGDVERKITATNDDSWSSNATNHWDSNET